MRNGGQRQKGSAFEREIAAAIVGTFGKFGIGKTDCYRTPGSGGHRFASKEDPGDLVISPSLRKYWAFSVECKFYAKIEMHLLMQRDICGGNFASWWTQAVGASKVNGKWIPLLVFRANRSETFAMLPDTTEMEEMVGSFRPAIRTRVNGEPVQVVRWKQFLARVLRRVNAQRSTKHRHSLRS